MVDQIRLQALARFNNLELENDKELLEIVELASAVSNSPYAMITFMDNETQNLIVRKGISKITVPRNISFCTHTLAGNDLLVVPDLIKDTRFINNPWVTGKENLRFYAGVPLITHEGEKIGTLCVFDNIPHNLNDQEKMMIKILGNQVIKTLEFRAGLEILKKHEIELSEQRLINNDANIRLRSFFESSTTFQVLIGIKGEIIDFNKAAYNFINNAYNNKLTRGEHFVKYVDDAFLEPFTKNYNLALQGIRTMHEGSTFYEPLGILYWEATFEPVRNDDNEIISISYTVRDVTERKLKEQKIIEQNQSLVDIAHIQAHEFRGPLTTIMGLINLIKEENYSAPPAYFEYLEQAAIILDEKIRKVVRDVEKMVIDPK